MTKKVAIFIEQQYHDTEFWVPYYRMLEAGFEVTVVGPEANTIYPSKSNDKSGKSEMSSAEAKNKKWDAVIVPGGWAPDYLRRDPNLLEIVKKTKEHGIVAGICHAPSVFVSADILRGVKATSTFAIKDDVVNAGAIYVDEEVVVDQNLITSRTPKDLPAFCKAIVAALQ